MQHSRLILSFSLSFSLLALISGCGGTAPNPNTAKVDPKPAPTNSKPQGDASGEETANAESQEDGEEKKPVLSFAELRTAVLACPANERHEVEGDCPGAEQWFDSETPAFENGKANGELLKMLASQDPKERLVATQKLRTTLSEHLDAKSADIVLDAAEKERDESVLTWTALLVSEQPLAKVGKLDRAIAIAKAHPVDGYREDFLFQAAGENRDPKLFAYAQEARKAESESLRNAAIGVFIEFARDNPAESCKVLDAYRTDPSALARDNAIENMARISQCLPYADKVIDYLGKVELKKDLGYQTVRSLGTFCSRKEITPAQKDRITKAAQRITGGKDVPGHIRAYALETAVVCDSKGGPAFAAKFKNDPNKDLAKAAAKHAK